MTGKDEDRARRLAAALRDNLKRRKAQARSLSGRAGGEGERNVDSEERS